MDISCKSSKLYLEKCDGYYRDKCVFAVEIDIEDTMALCVKYDKGAVMTYSLVHIHRMRLAYGY